jgi:hypothetical protein
MAGIGRVRVLAAVLLAALVGGAGIAAAVIDGERAPLQTGLLLPDLDIDAPVGLIVQDAGTGSKPRFRLGFVSAAGNVGVGPLLIHGSRQSLASETMVADQVIFGADGSSSIVPGVGSLEYVEAETHEHWHLLRFMSYELRRADDFELVRPDRKTGFCLGDRYNVDPATRLPGEPTDRVYNSNCGPGDRGLLSIAEGISVGWGDVYEAWRDAQYVNVTGLASGRYLLVHRVNADKRLRESRYGNNASSVLLSLTWPHGKGAKPRIRVLATCPDTARCQAPR